VNPHIRTIIIWVVLIGGLFILFKVLSSPSLGEQQLDQSEFYDLVLARKIEEVKIIGDSSGTGYDITGTLTERGLDRKTKRFSTYVVKDENLVSMLRDSGAIIKAEKPKDGSYWTYILTWVPMILLIGIWIFFMRQMQVGGNKALSFGKSKAKLLSSQGKKVTFKDVAGVDEAKEELQEIIEFLKDPQKFQKLGGKIPKGVLLMGPPGTGKTLLARAISGEANVPFFSISGSDFVEMFVGVGASRVRDLFDQGKKNAPCIIFIDELDAVGRHRGAGLGGGHDEREQTLNQLLVEMDGFETNEGVILIAATNRPDVLDPALLRAGRFDRRIVVNRPDVKGREEILEVHTRNTPLNSDVELSVIARGTPGFSGADLANLVNEAALLAARYGKKSIHQEDFEVAKDKVLMGTERRSLIISDEEKRNTAYHEAGHALVATLLPGADPIHKVTIIPRGMALGVTQQLPIDEKHNYTKHYILAEITVLLGGRVSEELFIKNMTTGAGNDIDRTTDLARKMVCEWGMSENMGPLTFGKKEEQIFLGREIAQHRDYSEATAIQIDEEVKKLITDCYDQATKLISENKDSLVRIAENLLEREVLDAHQIEALIKGEELEPIETKAKPEKKDTAADEKAEEKGSQTEEAEKKKALGGSPVKQPG
jgi:cell division protease FtsH